MPKDKDPTNKPKSKYSLKARAAGAPTRGFRAVTYYLEPRPEADKG